MIRITRFARTSTSSRAAGCAPALCLLACAAAAQGGAEMAVEEDIEDKVARMTSEVSSARLRSTVESLVGFGTRHVLSRTDSETEGTGAARAWLVEQYEALIPGSGDRLTVERDEHRVSVRRRGMPDGVAVVNIVATLRGTRDPDRVYLVSGHYDSRNSTGSDGEEAAPGANDDGSGTAAALEACRVMCGTEFPATLMFVAYDGEEQGLLGSRSHAEALHAAGVRVDGMITCDIVGNTLGMDGERYDDYVRCFSYSVTGNDSPGRSLARAATFAARRHDVGLPVKIIYRGDRYGRGGDHRPFFDQGFPAVRLTEPREDYSRQHQDITERGGRPYGDLPEFMDFEYLTRVTRVVVATLAELASAPPPPLVRGARGARDAYDTRVFFTLPEGTVDYEFVWRDTTAADWEGVMSREQATVEVGQRGLRATLPGLCLDEVVVGVRTIGPDGSRSRVATPPEPDRFNLRRGGGGRDR